MDISLTWVVIYLILHLICAVVAFGIYNHDQFLSWHIDKSLVVFMATLCLFAGPFALITVALCILAAGDTRFGITFRL